MEKNYLFVDRVSGEEFIVMANCYPEAIDIAKEYFVYPRFLDILSDFEAELTGLDIY